MDRLRDKRTLITGGTSGIGLATAKIFLEEGARVAITSSSQTSLDSARKILGSTVEYFVSDASVVPAQDELAERIKSSFGNLDALFVNAGIAELRPVEQWTEEAFNRSFATNVRGPFFLIRALLPVFANPASVVLNASINAHIGMPNTSVYGATKAALLSMSRTLSGELIGRGIRVNAVSPGPIATPLYDKLGLPAAELKGISESLQQQVPAKRFGAPEEIAKAVLFLATDESAFTVGSELIIDGGLGL
jgi:NAD(P)-dependent dehydrogenase (short-subunit alcohol dehydrogenase family)